VEIVVAFCIAGGVISCSLQADADKSKGPGPAIEHTVVFSTPDNFAVWPANNGVWSWCDNEILVGFSYGDYLVAM